MKFTAALTDHDRIINLTFPFEIDRSHLHLHCNGSVDTDDQPTSIASFTCCPNYEQVNTVIVLSCSTQICLQLYCVHHKNFVVGTFSEVLLGLEPRFSEDIT
jgi:hypothetical protein